MDGLENFAGYIIAKMGLQNFEFRTSENLDQNYTYVNLHSEGGLYKPNNEFLQIIEDLNQIFLKMNGKSLDTDPSFMKRLLNENFVIGEDIAKRFFLGRTYFRIRFLNRDMKDSEVISKNKKKR